MITTASIKSMRKWAVSATKIRLWESILSLILMDTGSRSYQNVNKGIKLRENTFKLLYCNDFHNRSEMPKQYDLFWEETPEVSEEDRKFISNRVDAIAEKIDEIDEAINKAAVKWTTDRMSKVDLTILRLAYYEMKIDEDIPEKVAVDQAIELAKKYGTDDSPSFVNGVLAKLF